MMGGRFWLGLVLLLFCLPLFVGEQVGELPFSGLRRVLVGDARTLSHHLGHREVRDALAVGEASPAQDGAMWARRGDELLDQARLPYARGADHREQVAGPVLLCCLEGLLQQGELAVPAHHGGVQVPADGLGPGEDLQQAIRGDRKRSDAFVLILACGPDLDHPVTVPAVARSLEGSTGRRPGS